MVGIAANVRYSLTYKILSNKKKVIYRSNVRSAEKGYENKMSDSLGIIGREPIIVSKHDEGNDNDPKKVRMHVFNPHNLVGKSSILDEIEDGQKHRARVIKLIDDHVERFESHPERAKFLCSVNNDLYEEVMSYNEILRLAEAENENETLWKYKSIKAHEGPLTKDDKSYNGSSYNVMIEWENGEVTSEPLSLIAADDPVTCAQYAIDKDLLHLDGWKRFRHIAKNHKKFTRMVKQAKLRSYKHSTKYMFGFEVPKDYKHALQLDRKNENNRWSEATTIEMLAQKEYETFRDLGRNTKLPDGYKKIRVHLIYAVKHDGRHKARLVADGHLTTPPLDSVYSGVVSLRGLRLVVFLAELNDLETYATDIGNAYLETYTKEKLCIIAGPEFGALEGHMLMICKALYGLRTSGLRWHERLADCIRSMGFVPSKAEPDIWIRLNEDVYEYIAVYVDDLAIVARDPKSICDTLVNKHKFKLKGTGPISYHLGMGFVRDDDGTLCISPIKYINKICESFTRIFGHSPSQKFSSPIEKNDHPEIDTSELLDNEGIQRYQSLIGALQWVVSIGRFDIQTSVMTLSSYRAAPRRGHIDRVTRMYGYLSKMKNAAIRIRVGEPDFSNLPNQQFDWSTSAYGEAKEIIPHDAPEPHGKYVTLSHYVDANLLNCLATGRSVTGILHFANKTPIEWYSKKQATVETATYGSEFVAARTCVEQIIDLRYTLR